MESRRSWAMRSAQGRDEAQAGTAQIRDPKSRCPQLPVGGFGHGRCCGTSTRVRPVFTSEQDPALQLDALNGPAAGCARTFTGQASGVVTGRPELTACSSRAAARRRTGHWESSLGLADP